MPLGDERRSKKESDGSIFFHFQFNEKCKRTCVVPKVKQKNQDKRSANKNGFHDIGAFFFEVNENFIWPEHVPPDMSFLFLIKSRENYFCIQL